MVNLFAGYDEREAAGFATFVNSVVSRSSVPVSITALASRGLPQGSNSFTLSRFLVPHLLGYRGHAIFCDASDMLMLGDVAKLDALFDPAFAVQVVKHPDYTSAHERKYVGTPMECKQSNYARKNWASCMLINAEHEAWAGVDPLAISECPPLHLLRFGFMQDHEIGSLPPEWNVLVDEGQEDAGAKLLHWTAGTPQFKHYQNARRSLDWFREFEAATGVSHG